MNKKSVNRPATARAERSNNLRVPTSRNTQPCPSTPERAGAPPLECDISSISVASTRVTQGSGKSSSTVDLRRAELEEFKREKERKSREVEYAEARALIALADLTYAATLPSTTEQLKKEIDELNVEIEDLSNFNTVVPIILELEQKLDVRQRLLENAGIPTQEQSEKINALWKSISDVLKLDGVATPSGEDLKFSVESAASAPVLDLAQTLNFVEDYEKLKIGLVEIKEGVEKLRLQMAEQERIMKRLKVMENAMELHKMLEK